MASERIVVVSGLPASGKSTIARQLGPLLKLPVVDKDEILESLFPAERLLTPVERSDLSRQADELLQDEVERLGHAVVSSFWRRNELSTTSGTPIEWLHGLPRLVEVHCVCRAATAAHRFRLRGRHPSHGDALKSPAQLRDQFDALARLGPLGLGHVVSVDTEGPVDMADVAGRVRSAW